MYFTPNTDDQMTITHSSSHSTHAQARTARACHATSGPSACPSSAGTHTHACWCCNRLATPRITCSTARQTRSPRRGRPCADGTRSGAEVWRGAAPRSSVLGRRSAKRRACGAGPTRLGRGRRLRPRGPQGSRAVLGWRWRMHGHPPGRRCTPYTPWGSEECPRWTRPCKAPSCCSGRPLHEAAGSLSQPEPGR